MNFNESDFTVERLLAVMKSIPKVPRLPVRVVPKGNKPVFEVIENHGCRIVECAYLGHPTWLPAEFFDMREFVEE